MFKPIKHLGQNFLTSKKIAEDIVNAADIKPDDIVLEAGPGKGILTELLLKKAKKVIAIEKDKRLVKFLETKFSDSIKVSTLSVINDDILKFDPTTHNLQPTNYKIVANIPYYITSRFLRKFLSGAHQPTLMVLMVQKEVAERIIAKDGKESLLSISIKAYGKPEIVKRVSAGNFSPKPKVDSAIIKISQISKNFFKDLHPASPLLRGRSKEGAEKLFFELVKKGFSQKRKMLINNLKCGPEIFAKCCLSPKTRAENLSLEDWGCLTNCQG